jgi:hypothetical protein
MKILLAISIISILIGLLLAKTEKPDNYHEPKNH